MRETVILRDAHCVFPGCRRDSRACDLDHITEYLPMEDGGPPGQTHPGNLAPLCRTHHRIKTHSAWRLQTTRRRQLYVDRPTGHQYDVSPDLTTDSKNLTAHHPGTAGATGMRWVSPVRSLRVSSVRSLLDHHRCSSTSAKVVTLRRTQACRVGR